jgi:porphobilinogen deaminase
MVSQSTVIGERQKSVLGWPTAVLRDENLDALILNSRNLERTAAQHVSMCSSVPVDLFFACQTSGYINLSVLQLAPEKVVFK